MSRQKYGIERRLRERLDGLQLAVSSGCIKCNMKVVISPFCYALLVLGSAPGMSWEVSCFFQNYNSRTELSDVIKIKLDQIISMRSSKIFVLDFRECKVVR